VSTNNKGVNMACGEFAKPIYDLLDELGNGEEALDLVLGALVKHISGDQVRDFVSSFRRDYELDVSDEDDWVDDIVEKEELAEDDVERLASWTQSVSQEEDEKLIASYFSSLIPEC
tara:strand:- start:87 stop:434 length:348 start_codon:yes stop_codon:yes gene_type:complete